MRVTFLGTGTSHGVPFIGCDCAVCGSSDPRDRRTRPSILIDFDRSSGQDPSATDVFAGGPERSAIAAAVRYVLVDTATDLRAQALALDIRRVDAVLFTHSHADHVMGLDEVRRYNALQRDAISCFADERTLGDLRRTFDYIFNPPVGPAGGIPQLTLFRIAGPFLLGGVEFVP